MGPLGKASNRNLIPYSCRREDVVRKAFAQFDENGDGVISAEELERVTATVMEGATAPEIKRMLADADTNGDGVIDFEEVGLFLHSKP